MGFTFWPLGKVLQYRAENQHIPARTAIVTFDDGFAATWIYAYPVVRELGVPIVLFLTTGYLDHSEPFPFDSWGNAFMDRAPVEVYRPRTMDQCRRLTEGGLVELGAHTHTHEDFRGRPEAFQRDLEACVEVLRDCFGKLNPGFAFPYGSSIRGFSEEKLTAAARRTGVQCGLTTEPTLVKLTSDPFTWGRFNVFNWDTKATLAAKLEGWYSWAYNMKCQLIFRKDRILQKL
jgi:peptidoglycan/xylan/chitin deacetylase (PgdA/CDA1 family)